MFFDNWLFLRFGLALWRQVIRWMFVLILILVCKETHSYTAVPIRRSVFKITEGGKPCYRKRLGRLWTTTTRTPPTASSRNGTVSRNSATIRWRRRRVFFSKYSDQKTWVLFYSPKCSLNIHPAPKLLCYVELNRALAQFGFLLALSFFMLASMMSNISLFIFIILPYCLFSLFFVFVFVFVLTLLLLLLSSIYHLCSQYAQCNFAFRPHFWE